ncbi:hypothetical protein EW146_g171 [Bondarzewia mesenterica]|uniref:Protein kinase domain-containing protein n=1 Tax=Bondarzewia mesenterica TaxID=1095465 RepID=A0A4S4ME43_9AGAM|nr:hypothetical protein EW146_g171 [Bondarzewia mesenterica]
MSCFSPRRTYPTSIAHPAKQAFPHPAALLTSSIPSALPPHSPLSSFDVAHSFDSPMLSPSPLRRKSLFGTDQGQDSFVLDMSDDEDGPAQSPYRLSASFATHQTTAHNLQAKTVQGKGDMGKSVAPPMPVEDDEDEIGIFLSSSSSSTPAPRRTSDRPHSSRAKRPRRSPMPLPSPSLIPQDASLPLRTPVKQSSTRVQYTQGSARPALAIKQQTAPTQNVFHRSLSPTAVDSPPPSPVRLPSHTPNSVISSTPVARLPNTTGTKRKPTALPVTTPYRKRAMTPLSVTKTSGEGSFDRLAPLPAPKFRSTRSGAETDGFLTGGQDTMHRLKIGEVEDEVPLSRSTFEEEDEDEAMDISPGGHVIKRRARSRPVSWESMNGARRNFHKSPKKRHPSHPMDTFSTITFPSARSRKSSTSSTSSTSPGPRQRNINASHVSTSTRRTRTHSTSLSRKPVAITQTREVPRTAPRRIESSGSATLFFGPPIPPSNTPFKDRHSMYLNSPPPTSVRPQPLFGRPQAVSRHSYAGSSSAFEPESSWASPMRSSSPLSMTKGTDDDGMDELSDEGHFIPMDIGAFNDITHQDHQVSEVPPEADEEDIFFGSTSFKGRSRDKGEDTSFDDSFGWGSVPETSFSFSVIESTPSPRSKKLFGSGRTVPKLEKKYKPRDSGVVLSDDEDIGSSFPRNMGRGFGRSGSMLEPPLFGAGMPTASTSVSTIASSDQELITPGIAPSELSGWPLAPPGIVNGSDSEGALSIGALQARSDVDAFIVRTLLQSQSTDAQPKRPPGTPQKRIKTAGGFGFGQRPWQSAVASKVGFDFGDDDGSKGKSAKKAKPRKSMPAAFPILSSAKKAKKSKAEESTDEEDVNSITKYEGLGMGRPSVGKAGVGSWLLRRSSSGAISITSAGSGSGEGSWPGTPTAGKASGWHLPPPQIPSYFSPSKPTVSSHLSVHRAAPSSSSSTTTSFAPNSPTSHVGGVPQSLPTSMPMHRRGKSVQHQIAPQASPFKIPCLPQHNHASHAPSTLRPRPSLGFLGFGTPKVSENEKPGKFEREFVEFGEAGSGQFGKVMKVRQKDRGGQVWAIKKSKRFEGVRHRLRLREEVEILQHLSQSMLASTHGASSKHPNILAYIDSWEQDEALFIQTELCELGNFAHFLWEYGKAFPKLEEARVWKILADLSNGLRAIHDAGVIHLDLKPANIFVTGEGRFKIGDFGMASLWPRPSLAVTPAGAETHSQMVRATGFEREGDKVYLAPEVLQGRYGKAADMFSFGVTMLETASNIVVPDQGEPWQRLRQEDFSQIDVGESVELFELIKSMMRTDPALRVEIGTVWAHPVVARTRMAMERMLWQSRRTGEPVFAASPLAPVPEGFLEEILGSRAPVVWGDAMDVAA